MIFFLGTHCTEWRDRTAVPLFLSARRLRQRRVPESADPWALDSGAYTEILDHGMWTVGPREYADEALRWRDAMPQIAFAAPQDWPCEKQVLAKSRLNIREHQRRTTENYLALLRMEPSLPWTPVLQGWSVDDYLAHAEQYAAAGVRLRESATVGVGSVCRRNAVEDIQDVFHALRPLRLRLHGFGLKGEAVLQCAQLLHSSDSMAWSYHARRARHPMLPDCKHRKCANCFRWAMAWRRRLLEIIERGETKPMQWRLFV